MVEKRGGFLRRIRLPGFLSPRYIPYYLIGLAAFLVAFAGGVTVWEYTNSPEFCGATCHTMPPEYVAYQVSAHARVACVDCHLGQESTLTTVPRKAAEIRHVIFALTAEYETPIYVKTLRPAMDTCEKCHWPEKFSDDSVRETRRFDKDESNTERSIFLSMKTGGGTTREGLGKGIHWHIENEVWFIAMDSHKQEIPYVRQVRSDGAVTEYFDVEMDLPPDFVAKNGDKLRRMDCIDCHNRISHLFRSPDKAVDLALARRQIDRDVPFIKSWGTEILTAGYVTQDDAMEAIDRLETWYQVNYPKYYAANKPNIQVAMQVLKSIYQHTVFPDMDVGWLTHPDNIGHYEFPGCFRCHDGKHLSAAGAAIRLECNICHTIPQVTVEGRGAPVISLARGPEPASHLDSNWIARHRFELDASCNNCHDTSNPGGKDNSSFCANSACHGVAWKFAGLNAPAIVELSKRGQVAQQEPGAVVFPTPASPPPRISHAVAGFVACQYCHSTGRDNAPVNPPSHIGYTNDVCLGCHKPK